MSKFSAQVVWLSVLVALLLPAFGCHRDQAQVYQVPQDQNQPSSPQASTAGGTNVAASSLPAGHPDISSMQSMPAGMVAPDTSAATVAWKTPAGWTQVAPSEMRVGSFKITDVAGKQADVSIIPLAGMGGSDFANVNRWRGQVGLPPAPDGVLQSEAENVEAGGRPAQLFDIVGTNAAGGGASRIIAVVQHRDDTAWFFKMTGDADLVEQQKPVFVDFLKTLSFSSPESPAGLPPGHPVIGDMNTTEATGSISHEGQPAWTVPTGWQEAPAGSFLLAKFTIAGNGSASAIVNVSQSTGDGGGLMSNFNRWRGQLGLPPADQALAINFPVPGGQGQAVSIDGTNVETGLAAEIQAVVVSLSDHTYFYKLMGDPSTVDAHKQEFMTFVKGVKY
ncbi:MAG TPA: hypothetical protein VMH87_02545 [Pseudomonadales bacterium]|nr:hypothetical protein [Pseudomonadales bacterium]